MSYKVPADFKYNKSHEWAQLSDDIVTIGVTDFAQSQLGDIVFVDLPQVGTQLEKGATFGVIESIKSVSDLYSPVSGEVVETNANLEDEPEKINNDPYDTWIIRVKVPNSADFESMLDDSAYSQCCQE